MPQIGVAFQVHSAEHPAPIGHPENAGRLAATASVIERFRAAKTAVDIERHHFGRTAIDRIHLPAHVDQIEALANAGGGHADPDTFVSPQSFQAATIVIDAALSAVEASLSGKRAMSFILGRPPGHHAERDHAMGFCLFNTVAIAAQYAVDAFGCKRIGIVDFDVHHGNGTQHSFYDRADVLFISTHQFPFYPGSGSAGERGVGDGDGYTLNFPLWARTGDSQALPLYERDIRDALIAYSPDLLLVSAGFDAHQLDPLAGLQWTSEAYGIIAAVLRDVANRCCGGKMISILEGGYNPAALAESIHYYIKGLTD